MDPGINKKNTPMLAVLILIAFLFIAEVTAMLALDKLFITSEFFGWKHFLMPVSWRWRRH